MTANVTLDDVDFDLPEALIALRPVRPRPASRLLVSTPGGTRHRHFTDLPDELRPGDLLVFNNTKVIPARLRGTRRRSSPHGSGEAQVEITLIAPDPEGRWQALARPAKRLAAGDLIEIAEGLSARVIERAGGEVRLAFETEDLNAALDRHGEMPLPPYIASKRCADAQDRDDYQSVFARVSGAIAAPTASLHFDAGLLEALSQAGVASTEVTLHVGAGTFLPVTANSLDDHKMHAERGEIPEGAAAAMAEARARGGRVIPVGTTALRLIETAAAKTGRVVPWTGETDLFIRPGFPFQASDGLITNFHLPRSTLMLLVAAFVGLERVRGIYAEAIAREYRFFSFGDGSLLWPG